MLRKLPQPTPLPVIYTVNDSSFTPEDIQHGINLIARGRELSSEAYRRMLEYFESHPEVRDESVKKALYYEIHPAEGLRAAMKFAKDSGMLSALDNIPTDDLEESIEIINSKYEEFDAFLQRKSPEPSHKAVRVRVSNIAENDYFKLFDEEMPEEVNFLLEDTPEDLQLQGMGIPLSSERQYIFYVPRELLQEVLNTLEGIRQRKPGLLGQEVVEPELFSEREIADCLHFELRKRYLPLV